MSGKVWAIYIRRSSKREGDADVSDETQEAVARSRIPEDATDEVFSDSGGHNSGFTTDRPAYQRMLADLRSERLAGISAYSQSRLNRNAENDLALLRECVAHGVRLSVGDGQDLSTPSGKLTHGINAVVSQNYRDQMSATMVAQARQVFEQGGHRGNDPFGYHTVRDERWRPVRPRTLAIDPDEAEVVRQVFALLTSHPFSETAVILQRERVRRRVLGPWTTAAINDLYRRREMYRGNVTSRRGVEVLPGRRPAILSDEEYADAVAGVEARKRHKAAKPSFARRTYALRGLIYCSCGARMRGDTRISRGRGWSYYACPVADGRHQMEVDGRPVECHARRVPAKEAERAVLSGLMTAALPPDAIEAVAAELRRRLESPTPGTSDRERQRLRTRMEQLRKQNEWGDLSDTEYRRLRAEVEADLLAIPGEADKVIMFDRHRLVVQSLGDELAAATPEAIQQVVALLVERVETRDREVVGWVPTGAAEPFFDAAMLSLWRPRTDSNRRRAP
jgi:DNA invertase Pin-like site-specific DNA recombinase